MAPAGASPNRSALADQLRGQHHPLPGKLRFRRGPGTDYSRYATNDIARFDCDQPALPSSFGTNEANVPPVSVTTPPMAPRIKAPPDRAGSTSALAPVLTWMNCCIATTWAEVTLHQWANALAANVLQPTRPGREPGRGNLGVLHRHRNRHQPKLPVADQQRPWDDVLQYHRRHDIQLYTITPQLWFSPPTTATNTGMIASRSLRHHSRYFRRLKLSRSPLPWSTPPGPGHGR